QVASVRPRLREGQARAPARPRRLTAEGNRACSSLSLFYDEVASPAHRDLAWGANPMHPWEQYKNRRGGRTVCFTFPDDVRWNAEQEAVDFGVEVGEYR